MKRGRRARGLSVVVAVLVVLSLGAATQRPTETAATAVAGATATAVEARLVAVEPVRLVDTRSGATPLQTSPSGTTTQLDIRAVVDRSARRFGVKPVDVVGGFVNVTVVEPTRAGYAVIHPRSAHIPDASTSNFVAGDVVANTGMTRFHERTLSVTLVTPQESASAHLIVDLLGLIVRPAIDTGGYLAVASPRRVLDTRSGASLAGGAEVTVALGSPEPALVNLTLVNDGPGAQSTFVTPVTARPAGEVSLVNAPAGTVRANAALLVPDEEGRVVLRQAFGEAHLLVDVVGRITDHRSGSSSLLLLEEPFRAIDSRPQGLGAGQAESWDLTPMINSLRERGQLDPTARVAAVAGNLTATNLRRRVPMLPVRTFMSVHNDLRILPRTSSLNVEEGRDIANGGVFPLVDNTLVVYNDDGVVDYLIDVTAVLVQSQ